MTPDELTTLVECHHSEMTELFPDYTLAELRTMRHREQRRRHSRAFNARQRGTEPVADIAERRMRDDARQGSEALLQAMWKLLDNTRMTA